MTRELCRKPFPGVGSTRTHCGISVSRSVVNGSTATQGVAASAWSGSLPQAGPPWCPRALVQSPPRRAGDGAALAPFVPRHAGVFGPSGARECRERTHPLGLRSRSPAWPRPSSRRPGAGPVRRAPGDLEQPFAPDANRGPSARSGSAQLVHEASGTYSCGR